MKIDVIRSGGQSQGGLDQSGGTLSGPLMLSRNPQLPLEAATKAYIDAELQTLNASNFTTGTLAIARLPVFSGDVSNEAGSNTINLSNSGVTAAEYGKIVVNEKGRVTNGTVLAGSDIPNIGFDKIISDKPSTLNGYGITNGVPVSGVLMTGALNLSSNPSTSENLVTKQYVDGMVNSLSSAKTGDIVRKSYSTTPVGFLKCNGALVDKTSYADLYAIIGNSDTSFNMIGSGKPWQQQYDINNTQLSELNTWTAGTALPGALGWSSAVVTKNRVYLFGGWNGSAYSSIVYTAVINIDGSLGSWTTGTALPGPLGVSQAIVTKNRIYLVAGYSGTVYSSTVYTAAINSDGTIGTWGAVSTLPAATSGGQAIVTKTRIYYLGGFTPTIVSSVYSAPLNPDGSIGTWITDTSLPGGLAYSQAAVTKNRVYLLGGESTTGATATVYTAIINADGTLGTWTTGTSLPAVVRYAQAAVTKNRVYLFGGSNASGALSSVYTAPINVDGTLGTWTTGTSLPSNINTSQVIITKNKIHLLGGSNGTTYSSAVISTPFSSSINDYSPYYEDLISNYMMPGSGKPWQQQYQINMSHTGNITGWVTGTAMPSGLFFGVSVATKNRVYMIGGWNGTSLTNTIYTAVINADGSLGTWTTTTPFPISFYGAETIVVKNKVYILGGSSDYGLVTGRLNSIYVATINSDGTLGNWSLSNLTLPTLLSTFQAVITKDKLYILGGTNGTTALNSVYYSTINSDGSLGNWVSSTSLPTILMGFRSIITKNRIYLIGGWNGQPYVDYNTNIYTATINSDGIIGGWSIHGAIPIGIAENQIYITNNVIYLLGGINGSGTLSSVYYIFIKLDGTMTGWAQAANLPVSLRYSGLITTNNRLYLMSGVTGSGTITPNVYYVNISEGLNDYSPYYNGTITPLEPANPSTLFKLPDMSAIDVSGLYHYIKY